MTAPPKPPMPSRPTPEQSLASQRQCVKILPFIRGFGWIGFNIIFFFFVSTNFSDVILIQIGLTTAVAIATLVADVVFYKYMIKNMEQMAQQLASKTEVESNQDQTESWWAK
jgi:hypothetical protein